MKYLHGFKRFTKVVLIFFSFLNVMFFFSFIIQYFISLMIILFFFSLCAFYKIFLTVLFWWFPIFFLFVCPYINIYFLVESMPRVTFKKQIKTRVRHKIKNVFQFHHFPFSYLSDSVPIFLLFFVWYYFSSAMVFFIKFDIHSFYFNLFCLC